MKQFHASLKEDLTMLSTLSTQSDPYLRSLRIIYSWIKWDGRYYAGDENDIRRGELFQNCIAQVLTTSQCDIIFKSLCALHIDGSVYTDYWLKWIVPYCLSLESLSVVDLIVDPSYRENSLWKDKTRSSTPSQCTTIFESAHCILSAPIWQGNGWNGLVRTVLASTLHS